MAWPQDAYVGQKVVCVDAQRPLFESYPDGIQPVRGKTYTISSIGPWKGRVHVDLLEMPKYAVSACDWWVMRFRPVQTKSTDTGMAILRKLQDPANHKVLEGV